MKIPPLMGSPNPKGSTFLLADAFRQGAEGSGHEVHMIDVAQARVPPCGGCVACGYDGPCAKRDGMARIGAAILKADLLVPATPLYSYGMSAQRKTVIRRFCALNGRIQRKRMKSALLSAAWNADGWTFDALAAHSHAPVRYWNIQNQGMVLGKGRGTPSMARASPYPEQVRQLGQNL